MESFTEGVNQFVRTLNVTAELKPMIVALQHAAEELDTNGVNAALLNVFGTTYRTILKQVGTGTDGPTEAEQFLDSL